ncbi:MBG domain-containing protein [Furfurilactobacillus siliginis]|nr:MBG domain-containing protein [Furfurilactobacillus siliginis]
MVNLMLMPALLAHTVLPTKGDALVYTITDISKDVDKGTYPVEVLTNDGDNGNYAITKVAGTLTIGAQPLTPATPNTPDKPVDPKTPNDNPQLETSVVVKGATKVYDGDATTDPTTFTVLAPKNYSDFVIPELTKDDFTTEITSQNVGNYTVKLNAAGLAKLQAANKNYDVQGEDIQDGLFVITKAPITLTAPTLTKVFDGKPYAETDAEHPLNVVTPSGVPAKGVAPVASLTDISKDFHAGKYAIDVTADEAVNANYEITKVAGSLTITPRPLNPATPNTPGQPANPDNPSNNPQLVSSMVIFGATKVYDGDVTTDPTTYEVKAPSKYGDFIIPALTADAFNLDGITSQNVGKYPVRLSQAGIDAIKAANPDYTFNANDIQDALFVITKAPVTITAPSASKTYDGKPYVNANFVGTNTTLPAKGDALVYTITDISKDVDKGSYPVEVLTNDTDNGNYEISKVAGALTIGAQPLTPVTPNTPTTPVNPKTPNDNPQLETSVVVQGTTKVYDGDATTDPTTFTVLAPSKYADFVMPTFEASDFDVTGISSQNVGNYTVKLTAAGLQKLQAANKNYTLTADDVQDGLFVITKAPITLTAPTVTKVFDGKPFTDTAALVVSPTGVPAKGIAPVATLTDISKDFHAGKYGINVVADEAANVNYTITTVAGSLTITPRPLNPATPNTPDQPANPDNPSDNPQLLNSMVIQGATKVYDGDVATDPTTYKVTAPSKYTDFIIPSLTAADFNLDGITSQNVGNYPVRLSQSGIDRIKAANPDYTFNAGDIQDALFVITKAPVTITAPQLAKTYDGKAYNGIVRAQTSIMPAKGEALVYKLTDISKITDQGTYTIDVLTAPSDNLNYQITDVPGQLVISRHSLVPVDPNKPNKPVNPITPDKNPQLDASVVVSGATKVYDGDAATDPTTFTVLAPKNYSDFVLPTFTKDDFTTEITSQDVGNYTVKLNEAGLAKLQAANKNYDVKGEDVQDGLFVITKAPLTLTAPTLTKVYDGLPYQDKAKEVVAVAGKPAKGIAPVATLSDISALYHAGKYDINVLATDAANKNYQLTLVNGLLTISAKPLTPAEPNKPGKPVNPITPDKNPQLEASVVVEGATKVYDGDKATDPTIFTVLAPKADRDFMIPQLTASDFTTEITSQNVGNYTVKLSATGFAKLQAANRDYDLKEADVQDGLFVITKAPVTVTAGSVTKTYDGKPYADKIATSVSGQPKLGDAVVYTLSDLSSFINKGTYAVNVMTKATDNGNYVLTTVPGTLTITAQGLTPVVPNKPGKPVNPGTPTKNPQLETSVVVQGATKLYDGDSATDPTTFTVLAPSKYPDFVIPTLLKDDFDTTGITSQNVGQYAVTLSKTGLAKLQAANKNYDFTSEDVQNGLFIINPAPVTITAPSGSKAYDGQPYPSAKLVANEQGVPAKGDKLQYTLTDVSHDINKGTYPVEVLTKTSDNLNYVVKTVAGTVTITAQGLTPVVPNKPGKPVNPGTPTKNPQLETSVVVQGATKVYDGDKLTDPTTFTVLAPSKYPDFVVPTLTKDDFDTTGITSQNVGQYAVTLSKTGLAKLQAANKNYDFTSEDVQNGLFVITPATITIAAPTLTKTYDGQPYAGTKQATLTGIPAKGTQPVYTMTDISRDSAIGTYPITITANATANGNYVVKTANGQLTITGDQYSLTANYVDGAGKTVAPSETKTDLNFDDDYTTTAKVVSGYVLIKTPANAKGVMPKGNVTVTYVYDKVGNYVVTPPAGGKTTTPYPNDPHNPGKVVTPTTPIIPGVPGYTPNDPNGKPLVPVDPKNPNKGYFPPTPGNPTTDTHITYTADKQTVVVLLVDSKGQAVVNAAGQSSYTLTGKSDTVVDFSTVNKLVNGYVVASDGTTQSLKFDHDDNVNQTVRVVYDKVGNYIVTPPTGGHQTITPYPNDPNNPGKVVTPTTPIVPGVPGYTPNDPNGKPLVPVDPNDPNKGYLPPVVPGNPTTDTHITYTADDQTVIVKLVDVNGSSVTNAAGVVGYSISGKTGANVDFTQVNKLVPGYVLKTDGTLTGLKFDNDDKTNQVVTITYARVGNYIVTPPTGGQTKTPYPNDPNNPAKIVTPTTPIVPNVPGFKPYGPDGKPLQPADPNDPNKGYLPPDVPSDPTIDTHITYVPNPKKPVTPVTPPVKPGQPTTPVVPSKPVTPTDTNQPHVPANTPVEVNTPVVTPNVGQPQRLMTISRHGKATPVAKAVAQTLPETGEQDSLSIAIAGLGMMISGLAFLGLRRKKHELD